MNIVLRSNTVIAISYMSLYVVLAKNTRILGNKKRKKERKFIEVIGDVIVGRGTAVKNKHRSIHDKIENYYDRKFKSTFM